MDTGFFRKFIQHEGLKVGDLQKEMERERKRRGTRETQTARKTGHTNDSCEKKSKGERGGGDLNVSVRNSSHCARKRRP